MERTGDPELARGSIPYWWAIPTINQWRTIEWIIKSVGFVRIKPQKTLLFCVILHSICSSKRKQPRGRHSCQTASSYLERRLLTSDFGNWQFRCDCPDESVPRKNFLGYHWLLCKRLNFYCWRVADTPTTTIDFLTPAKIPLFFVLGCTEFLIVFELKLLDRKQAFEMVMSLPIAAIEMIYEMNHAC